MKRGKSWTQFQPSALAMVSCVKKAKNLIGIIVVPQNVKAVYEGIPEGGVQAQIDAGSDS